MEIMLYLFFYGYYAMPQCPLLGPIMLQESAYIMLKNFCHEMIVYEICMRIRNQCALL